MHKRFPWHLVSLDQEGSPHCWVRIGAFTSLKADCISLAFLINHRCYRPFTSTHHPVCTKNKPSSLFQTGLIFSDATSSTPVRVTLRVLVQAIRTNETKFYRNKDVQSVSFLKLVANLKSIQSHSILMARTYYISKSNLIGKKQTYQVCHN